MRWGWGRYWVGYKEEDGVGRGVERGGVGGGDRVIKKRIRKKFFEENFLNKQERIHYN